MGVIGEVVPFEVAVKSISERVEIIIVISAVVVWDLSSLNELIVVCGPLL